MKFESIKDMPQLKKEIIIYLFEFIARKKYDEWWHYAGEFKYDGKEYNLECDVKLDNQVFSYKNLHIEHKQVVLDVDDVLNFDMRELARVKQ
jgi:hypothetical protein